LLNLLRRAAEARVREQVRRAVVAPLGRGQRRQIVLPGGRTGGPLAGDGHYPLRLDDAEGLERLAEHGCRVRAEPLLDEGGVYAAEVGSDREVVAEHELRKARRRTVHPALHRVTDDEI